MLALMQERRTQVRIEDYLTPTNGANTNNNEDIRGTQASFNFDNRNQM